MSGNKKKRHMMEVVGVICVLAVLGAGGFYLRTQQDKEKTDAAASGTDSWQDRNRENQTTPTPATSTPTPEPSESAEEKLAGPYQAVSWTMSPGLSVPMKCMFIIQSGERTDLRIF